MSGLSLIFFNSVDSCYLIPKFSVAVPRRRLRINFDHFNVLPFNLPKSCFYLTYFGLSNSTFIMCNWFNMMIHTYLYNIYYTSLYVLITLKDRNTHESHLLVVCLASSNWRLANNNTPRHLFLWICELWCGVLVL